MSKKNSENDLTEYEKIFKNFVSKSQDFKNFRKSDKRIIIGKMNKFTIFTPKKTIISTDDTPIKQSAQILNNWTRKFDTNYLLSTKTISNHWTNDLSLIILEYLKYVLTFSKNCNSIDAYDNVTVEFPQPNIIHLTGTGKQIFCMD